MRSRTERQLLRRFGLTVGGLFVVIGLWPLIWSQPYPRIWALVPGSLLVLCGWLLPHLLLPLHRGWMAAGRALGEVNTRIVLGVLFLGVLTPLGMLARWTGRDFMRMKPDDHDSYRVFRSARPTTHVRHQF